MSEQSSIVPITIEDEMRTAYIDYSMSVIVSRALPDVRDGLKPVHRRVLYGMAELGLTHNKPYKKSARIVGEVLGKYHPHGDASVYDAMVRMAQEWSLRYPLVDGQGNFGSIDGDSPAAMRYTEARLQRISEEMLADLHKDTVDFQPNFDDSLQEPVVLPAKIPHLLMNGASGIAVGMATNMAPHNLSESINAILHYIDQPDCSLEDLIKHLPAPDFPTGGLIYGYKGVKAAYKTGKGRVVIRARTEIEELPNGKVQIVATEIPYMVNKAAMIEKTAALINEKVIEGIADLRDESDRQGLRIVYELKPGAIPQVVLNKLYKYTQLQSTFSINNVGLVKGRPTLLTLKDIIHHFVEHRHEVVVRRTHFELDEAEKRIHILQGLLIALDHLDEVIRLIRAAIDPETAKTQLMERFALSEVQAKAILDMRLQRLTGLERSKIIEEHTKVQLQIAHLKAILADRQKRMQIIKDELLEIQQKYGDARRTTIVYDDSSDISIEDVIPDEPMVITISHQGYIKRTPLQEYRTQSRGGIGAKGASTKEDDFTEHLFIASNHNYLLIFTESGTVYWLKVYQIPEASKTAKGRAIQNLLQIDIQDKIRAILNVPNLDDEDYINNHYVIICTEKGMIKKTILEAYSRPRQSGINAINILENDHLLDVDITDGDTQILLATHQGQAVRFHESEVRPMGRVASGVRAIQLAEDDRLVGMVCVRSEDEDLLVVSERGYGKRSKVSDYRLTRRGGKGVRTMNLTEKTGKLVGIKSVQDEDEIMIINKSGIAIRLKVDEIRVMGRATQGVRLIRLNKGDAIASIAKISRENGRLNEDDIPNLTTSQESDS